MSASWRNGIAAFALGVGVQAVSDAAFWAQATVIVAVIAAYFWVQSGVETEARKRGRIDGLREAERIFLAHAGRGGTR